MRRYSGMKDISERWCDLHINFAFYADSPSCRFGQSMISDFTSD